MKWTALAVALSAFAGGLAVFPIVETAVRLDRASPLREPVFIVWSYLLMRFDSPVAAGYWFLYLVRVVGLLVALGYWAVAARGVRIRNWMLAILMALILPGLYEGFAVAHAVLCLTMGQVEAGVPKPPYWDAILVSLLAVLLLTSAASFGGRVPRDRSVSSL